LLDPLIEFDEGEYRYRLLGVYLYRVKAEVPEPEIPLGA
jgi:hypothetical protein